MHQPSRAVGMPISATKSVQTGNTPCEHMFSAVHPTTDIAKILRHVRFVPTTDIQADLGWSDFA
jgi:hypothetical protein